MITEALEMLGVLPEGVAPTAAQLTSCSRTLNSMLKAWQTRGTHLFVNQRTYLFMQKGDREYALHLTAASSDEYTTSFYATTVNGEVAATVTAVEVDSGANIADADRIGILAADGTMHWTTVASGGGTTSIVLTAADADNALADGAVVYSYTTKTSRPRKILHATWREAPKNDWGFHDSLDGAEIDIDVIARTDYASLSQKSADGRVNQIYFDKTWPKATVRVWPEPDKGGRYLVLWVERAIEDVETDVNFDMPQEWSLAIGVNLAMWLAPKFGVADKTWGRIVALARESLFDAESGDTEGGMFLQPDMSQG
jgi:hypothetical protein